MPLKEYLAPLISVELFRNGFCEEELGLRGEVLDAFLEGWEQRVQGFFSILCLEIWGRTVMRGEPMEAIEQLLTRVAHDAGSPANAARHVHATNNP